MRLPTLLIGMLLLCRMTTVGAQPPRPHVVLVLAGPLSLEEIEGSPALREMRRTAALGLMNRAVNGKPTLTAQLLTLAAGRQIPSEAEDPEAFETSEDVPGENGNGAQVYARRTGGESAILPESSWLIVHMGVASLSRRGLLGSMLGSALQSGRNPVSTILIAQEPIGAEGRAAALLGINSRGMSLGTFHSGDDPVLLAETASRTGVDFTIIEFPDGPVGVARADAVRRLALFLVMLRADTLQEGINPDVLIVGEAPAAGSIRGGYTSWQRLAPVMAFGPHFPPGALTSATTRTQGLIGNVDIAPTVLSLFNVPPPLDMIGRTIAVDTRRTDAADRVGLIARIDYLAALNGRAVILVTLPMAALLLPFICAGLIRLRRGPAPLLRAGAFCVLMGLCLGPATMLSPLLVPPSLWEYGLRTAAWMAALAAVCMLIGRASRISPALVAVALNILLLAADTLAGQPLLKDSLLCGYALSGIRYYGIGNEFLGLDLAFLLLGGFLYSENRSHYVVVAAWALFALLLGWPGLGANSGSLIATCAAFGTGAAALRGRRVTVISACLWTLGGILLAALFAVIDSRLNGAAGSHAGVAVNAAQRGRGVAYLLEISMRKAQMNLRLLTSVWLLLPAVIVAGLCAAVAKYLRDPLRAVAAAHPGLRRVLLPAIAGGVASLLFKDSGVVTVTFFVAGMLLMVLYYLLSEATVRREDASC